MATPVVTVASGGLPVTDVTSTLKIGLPITEATNGRGTAVTKVAAGGRPVVYSGVLDFPPPFTPASLTGLIAWYDTSILANLTLSGSNVTAFASPTPGLANTTLGPTGPGFATYSATGFNTSRPALVFTSGASSVMEVGSFPMGTGNTLTCWFVGTATQGASSPSGRMLSYRGGGQGNDFGNIGSWTLAEQTNNVNGVNIARNSLNTIVSGLTPYPAGHRVIATVDASGVMTVYVDGVPTVGSTVPGNWATGGLFDLGRQAGLAADYWYGAIAEAGVASGFTNATGVAQLDSYLKSKWGL